ncbi:DUF4232 domain-containing protein [Kitasatospora sp. NPDC004272]
MRVRNLTFATLTVAAALTLTACQDDGTDGAAAAPTSAAASTAAPAASAPPAAAPSQSKTTAAKGGGTASTSAPAGSGGGTAKCRTADLTLTATDATISDEPEGTVVVELKNHSGKSCSIGGYAGVDLQTSAGSLSAKRAGQALSPDVLASGKSIYFPISYPLNTSGGSGVRITGLVVTPPDETQSVTLTWPGGGSLPVTDGSGSQVTVGPMGSAGQGG